MSLMIAVTVKSQAKKESVVKTTNGDLVVSVHAPARDGKANQALVALLATHFSVARYAVKILHSHSCRKRLVFIGMP